MSRQYSHARGYPLITHDGFIPAHHLGITGVMAAIIDHDDLTFRVLGDLGHDGCK